MSATPPIGKPSQLLAEDALPQWMSNASCKKAEREVQRLIHKPTKPRFLRLLTVIASAFLLLCPASAKAQTPSSGNTDSAAVRGIEYHKEVPDSTLSQKVFFFHLHRAQTKIDRLYHPSLSPTGVHQSDPADALNGNYYISTGVAGQPHLPLFFPSSPTLGPSLMPDPTAGYSKRIGNILFYQTQTPFSRLAYHSSSEKDYVVRASHTQNIKPGWNASFDYLLLRPEGIYSNSGAKNHYLDFTTNYFSPDSRIQAAAAVVWNSYRLSENGGLADDESFSSGSSSTPTALPVLLYDVTTRHNDLQLFASASYSFVPQFERLRERDSIALSFSADSLPTADTLRLTDTLPAPAPSVLNAGTLGLEVLRDRRRRATLDSTLWLEHSVRLFWTNDVYPDHRWHNTLKLTLGIEPRKILAVIDSDTATLLSFLDPFASATLSLGRASLKADAELHGSFNPDGVPDSRLAARFLLPLDSLRRSELSLSASHTVRTPDYRLLHDADIHQGLSLKAISTSRLAAEAKYKEVAELSLSATRFSHHTWYDSLLQVQEGTSPFILYQASLTLRLQLSIVHLDMQHFLQHSSDASQMPLPLWACKNSLYADFPLFQRVLRVQVGTDIRFHTPFLSPEYDPYTGVFYHQSTTEVGGYLWADLFLNIQLKRASFYAKAGHLNAILEQHPNYFLLPHYPARALGFFWGINWLFFD